MWYTNTWTASWKAHFLSLIGMTMSGSTFVTRATLHIAAGLFLLSSSAGDAVGQDSIPHAGPLEFRIPGGVFIATGEQRHHLRNAQVTAAQLSWVVRSRTALTGTFAWARTRDIASADAPKLDVFTSDIGVETRSAEWNSDRPISLSVFGGLGAGARSYNYRKLDVDATNNIASYAAIGGEVGMGRVAVRLETRNYVTGFKPLTGAGKSHARNDVVILGAMRFNRGRAFPRKR